MIELRFPTWQKPYWDALVELDPRVLLSRIAAAEKLIFLRCQAVANKPDEQERQALDDALFSLRCLKREKLNFPTWEAGHVRMD